MDTPDRRGVPFSGIVPRTVRDQGKRRGGSDVGGER